MSKVDPAVQAARDAEEEAWQAYAVIRTSADLDAVAEALKAYDAARAVTDEAVRQASTPT